MPAELDPFCFSCKYFNPLVEAQKRLRIQILEYGGFIPPGMHGICAASQNENAHVLFNGELVSLHSHPKAKRAKTPPHHNPNTGLPTIAQAPCHVFDNRGRTKFILLSAIK